MAPLSLSGRKHPKAANNAPAPTCFHVHIQIPTPGLPPPAVLRDSQLVCGSSIPLLGKTQTKTRDFFNPLSLLSPCNQPSISNFQDAPSRTILSLSIASTRPQVWDGGGSPAAPQPHRVVLHSAGEGSCEDDKAGPLKSGEVCVLTTLTTASHGPPGGLLRHTGLLSPQLPGMTPPRGLCPGCPSA